MLYRIKQLIWAIRSIWKEIDYEYVRGFLNKDEILLFKKLKKSEQYHCIRVCRDSIKIAKSYGNNINYEMVGKLALLHDIGKSEYHINILTKAILVVVHKISKGNLKKFSNKPFIDIYYNHGKKGVIILTDNSKNKGDYSREFLDAIEKHHSLKSSTNILLNILREADNKN